MLFPNDRKLNFAVYEYNAAEVHIIPQLLLWFLMIDEFTLCAGTSSYIWPLIAPELQSTLTRLIYSPKMKYVSLTGFCNLPLTLFVMLTNITHLSMVCCTLEEDYVSFVNAEMGSIARLCSLYLCGFSTRMRKLVCARGQDGSPILDFSHLQKLDTSLLNWKALPAFQDLFKRVAHLTSIHLIGAQWKCTTFIYPSHVATFIC